MRLFVLVLAETPPNETSPPPHSRTGRKAYISRHGLVRFAAKDFGLSDLQSRRQDDAKVVGGTGEEDGGLNVVMPCLLVGVVEMGRAIQCYISLISVRCTSKNKRLHRQERARQWTLQQLLDTATNTPHCNNYSTGLRNIRTTASTVPTNYGAPSGSWR